MSANETPFNPLESTLERIARLYGTHDTAEGSAGRVPVASYAETATGATLAKLIDDLDASQAALPEPLEQTSGANGPDAILAGVGAVMDRVMGRHPEPPLSRTVKPVERHERLPVSSSSAVLPAGDALRRLFADFEHRLRTHLDLEVSNRGLALERSHQDKLRRLRQLAVAEVKNRDVEIKRRYEQHYHKKELLLRENYKKLTALANKIAAQKAQLQTARRQFEEKVQAANALYRQVEDMRRTLRDQLGSFAPRTSENRGMG